MGCFATDTITELGTDDPEVRATTDSYIERLTAAFENAITRGGTDVSLDPQIARERSTPLATMALGLSVRARGGLAPDDTAHVETAVRALVAPW